MPAVRRFLLKARAARRVGGQGRRSMPVRRHAPLLRGEAVVDQPVCSHDRPRRRAERRLHPRRLRQRRRRRRLRRRGGSGSRRDVVLAAACGRQRSQRAQKLRDVRLGGKVRDPRLVAEGRVCRRVLQGAERRGGEAVDGLHHAEARGRVPHAPAVPVREGHEGWLGRRRPNGLAAGQRSEAGGRADGGRPVPRQLPRAERAGHRRGGRVADQRRVERVRALAARDGRAGAHERAQRLARLLKLDGRLPVDTRKDGVLRLVQLQVLLLQLHLTLGQRLLQLADVALQLRYLFVVARLLLLLLLLQGSRRESRQRRVRRVVQQRHRGRVRHVRDVDATHHADLRRRAALVRSGGRHHPHEAASAGLRALPHHLHLLLEGALVLFQLADQVHLQVQLLLQPGNLRVPALVRQQPLQRLHLRPQLLVLTRQVLLRRRRRRRRLGRAARRRRHRHSVADLRPRHRRRRRRRRRRRLHRQRHAAALRVRDGHDGHHRAVPRQPRLRLRLRPAAGEARVRTQPRHAAAHRRRARPHRRRRRHAGRRRQWRARRRTLRRRRRRRGRQLRRGGHLRRLRARGA
eukprot:Rhum_TRINITY_DN7167_c0_g1::Rhum_TRINITY_DN7167_c0_g1_i1::g.21970::m.21970